MRPVCMMANAMEETIDGKMEEERRFTVGRWHQTRREIDALKTGKHKWEDRDETFQHVGRTTDDGIKAADDGNRVEIFSECSKLLDILITNN